jgi:SAM-dependent methyltransferase
MRHAFRIYKDVVLPNRYVTRRFIRSVAGSLSAQTCVEVGAGSCPFKRDLALAFQLSNYIASDIMPNDPTMLVADARYLPISDNTVDLLVAFDVVYLIPDYDVMLREAYRVLLPGGALLLTYTFLYSDFGAHDYHRWTVKGMEQDLAKAGFHVIAHQKRGGFLFMLMMMGASLLHNLAMGAARHSTDRTRTTVLLRMGLATLLVFPFQLFGWLALGVDRLLPSSGLYFGGMVLARRGPLIESQVPR